MRIIIYTGKGGVGKTSIAAATGLLLASQGYRTLVMSTDAAHSLSDSIQLPLGSEPVQISERLWGQEVDSLRELMCLTRMVPCSILLPHSSSI
jgi:arsenite-transporting ATPase